VDIFKKVSEGAKSIGEGAKTIGKKSSDLVESTKLKFEISKLEKEAENNITALGNLVYLQFKGEEGHAEEIDRLLKSTKTLEEEIDEMLDQVAKLHPKPPVCPQCQTELPITAKFCWNCGFKMTQETS
jgi:ribosomal protein L40E